jgi:serine phosphatase RsbU (regulator of sigma subunit)
VADSASSRYAELFATAVLLEFSVDARSVRLVSCGHPAPLLLRGRQATEIELAAWTPLGLGLPAGGPPAGLTLRLEPGHSLFLSSDGVSEARDADGSFYPLTDRLAALTDTDPAVLADRVWADLVRYCPAVVDDVTMLVLTPASPDVR